MENSSTVLIYCSRGYFQSKNCLRELRSAVRMEKSLITLLELDRSKGLSQYEIREQLLEGWRDEHGTMHCVTDLDLKWEFQGGPTRQAMSDALFSAGEPIEWNRFGPLQE